MKRRRMRTWSLTWCSLNWDCDNDDTGVDDDNDFNYVDDDADDEEEVDDDDKKLIWKSG